MSVKKKASAPSAAKVEAKVPNGTQTAAERRAAEAQLRELVTRFSPANHRLISAIRRSLRERLPTASELVYEYRDCFVISFSPSERGYEGVLAIRGNGAGVKLYFTLGKELPDPEKLLRGSSGAKTRFIDVERASTLAIPAVKNLIEEAIARNPVPFASTGRGAIISRSAAAK